MDKTELFKVVSALDDLTLELELEDKRKFLALWGSLALMPKLTAAYELVKEASPDELKAFILLWAALPSQSALVPTPTKTSIFRKPLPSS